MPQLLLLSHYILLPNNLRWNPAHNSPIDVRPVRRVLSVVTVSCPLPTQSDYELKLPQNNGSVRGRKVSKNGGNSRVMPKKADFHPQNAGCLPARHTGSQHLNSPEAIAREFARSCDWPQSSQNGCSPPRRKMKRVTHPARSATRYGSGLMRFFKRFSNRRMRCAPGHGA